MNRVFDAFFQGRGGGGRSGGNGTQRWVPAMDLTETAGEYVLRADLPGMRRDQVEIEVKDDVLTISGERRSEHENQGEGFHRIERSFGRFSRSLDLPKGVEAGAVKADFADGVLEVRIPKPEQALPTKVEIGAGRKSEDVIEAGAST
jgi:HSP20 family protein